MPNMALAEYSQLTPEKKTEYYWSRSFFDMGQTQPWDEMLIARPTKGVLFGTFDKLHDGHLDCLTQAASRCKSLVVIVARDEQVCALKGHSPWEGQDERVSALTKLGYQAVLGDASMGDYEVLRSIDPDVILVGYDQTGLLSSIQSKQKDGTLPRTRVVTLSTKDPTLHTSLLYPKK